MLRTVSIITAFICAAAALAPHAADRTPAVTLDTNRLGGYTGDYVLIYNPDTMADSARHTGSIQGMIQNEAPPPPPFAADEYGPIDIDGEVKHHFDHSHPPVQDGPHSDPFVGSRQTFYVDPFYSPNGELRLNFICLAEGEHCVVWGVSPVYENGWPLQDIDEGLAPALAAEFDSKYPLMHEYFGSDSHSTWHGDGRINLLCYNIEDGWNGFGAAVGGYFSSDTCMLSAAPTIHVDTYPTITTGSGAPTLDTAKRVLVHEYAHLITYARTYGSEDWLEEVIASAAEEICYPGSCIAPRITEYGNMNGASLYDWAGLFGHTEALYARGALFGQYLYSRFGNGIFGSIIDRLALGEPPVTAVFSCTGQTLADLVLGFNLAVLINDTGALDGTYGFATQPGYDPQLYGIADPYALLQPAMYGGQGCVIFGGGAILARTRYGAYYPPADADPGLVYVGVTITPASYTVTFYGLESAVISSQTVAEGQPAQAPLPPEEEGYTFVMWSCDIACITGDTEVYALYAENGKIKHGDADCDGRVGFTDISHICMCLNTAFEPDIAFYLNADIDGDGRVALSDASALYLLLIAGGGSFEE